MNKKFTEPIALNHVSRFHRTFLLPIIDDPSVPNEKRCELRINLLQEELNELKEALADKDVIEVADALCDIQYVLAGAILEFGMGEKFSQLFNEVQRSNMSKTCSTKEEALATQNYYLREKETQSYIVERDGKFLVFRSSDQKVLKSVNYSPANLQSILEE